VSPRHRPPRRGALVALEGIDGSGKTTVARALARRWRARGFRVQLHAEPTDPALAREGARFAATDPWRAAMYFTSDRWAQRPKVERALARGAIVISDRSFFSTLAYQGSALGAARRERLDGLQRRVALPPDRVVLLRLAEREANARRRSRGLPPAPTETPAILRRVIRAYASMARRPPWVVVDASRPRTEVVDAVDRRLAPWLARRLRRVR
jgi:dTMP kinase